jgi:hypothetical protein
MRNRAFEAAFLREKMKFGADGCRGSGRNCEDAGLVDLSRKNGGDCAGMIGTIRIVVRPMMQPGARGHRHGEQVPDDERESAGSFQRCAGTRHSCSSLGYRERFVKPPLVAICDESS